MIRKAAVAGSFYPAERERLIGFFEDLDLSPPDSLLAAKAIVVPHAAYVYSGRLAGEVYSRVQLPHRLVILCPNHTGMGPGLAIMSRGAWETPLGLAPIDEDLAAALQHSHPALEDSPLAHRNEHSLEVQLPFLQHRLGNDFRFVPICIARGSYDPLVALGAALGQTLQALPDPVLIISSSDMNHFESAETTLRKDELAIQKVINLDSRGLYDVVMQERITMCGYAPTIAAIEASKILGATQGMLIGHTHSGAVSGENRRVVGYAGIALC